MSNFNRGTRRMETPRHSSRSSFLSYERVDDTFLISEINSNFGLSEPAPITNGGHPRFRILSADMVAIFESDHHQFTYQIEEPLNSHSLSYENLLLLEERMGNVNSGLSHEAICRLLKLRSYLSSSKSDEICVVCQVNI
ncbi:hypothetical protein RJ641_015643 [Dillenia turbinata]|uniref:RING-type E3 ubiquitin transferase n=1 Tax=Dillenia turbinata TaxID=194707 RepID=A0AAN8YYD6_9MAGN